MLMMRRWVVTGVIAGVGLLGIPFLTAAHSADPPPSVVLTDTNKTERQRLAALDELWATTDSAGADRTAVREATKRLVWRGGDPAGLRIRAIDLLTADADPAGRADAINMLRLRLPTETNWDVIGHISKQAGANGWVEITPGLIRSYSRRVIQPADDERPERAALLALHPGKDIIDIVYEVFATPSTGEGTAKELADKARADAWSLMGRLDASGAKRAGLLASADAAAAGDPLLSDLVATARDLGVVAVTSSELEWARGLRAAKDPLDAQWWQEAKSAVAALSAEQRNGLAMRHVEPVRWAAKFQPTWLTTDRNGLITELERRLKGRRIVRRQAEDGDTGAGSAPERLDSWRDKFVWGDVLSILVIDEAVKDASLQAELVKQIEIDIRDTSTEHGGALTATTIPGAAGGPGYTPGYTANHFPPRPTQRVSDTRFVASDEMMKASRRSLAHYHFHAQRWDNREYSGPGPGDMEYATEHGRNCIVFTATKRGVINIDFYQRGGAVIDLGEIKLPQ